MFRYKMLINAMLVVFLFFPVFLWADAEEVQLADAELKLNANWHEAGEEWRSKPVFLMTHGTLAHGRMEIMATLQELLAEQGYSSLAINLSLGLDDRRGMYDCATPHTHRHTDAVDEIGAWYEWLLERGVSKVVLVGHSRGGNQTAWFAAEHNLGATLAVVLLAPATTDSQSLAAGYERRYGITLTKALEEAERLRALPEDNWMNMTGFLYCNEAKVKPASFLSYYQQDARMDTSTLIPHISKPVLVFAGSEDTTNPDVVEKFSPLADSEQVTLEVIEDADHFFRDLNADEVVEAVTAFLADLESN